jgi:hypothetical protein
MGVLTLRLHDDPSAIAEPMLLNVQACELRLQSLSAAELRHRTLQPSASLALEPTKRDGVASFKPSVRCTNPLSLWIDRSMDTELLEARIRDKS